MVTLSAKKAATGFAALLLAGGATLASIETADAQFKGVGIGYRGAPTVVSGPAFRGGGGFAYRGGFGGYRGGGVAYRGGWGGYRGAYYGGYRPYYRRGYGGGAVAAGLVGGLALGAIAASTAYPYGGYGYAPAYYGGGYGYAPVAYGDCYWVNRRVVNAWGELVIQRVQVCD
jgi:hypothetical protein